jgi:hypothetical protein
MQQNEYRMNTTILRQEPLGRVANQCGWGHRAFYGCPLGHLTDLVRVKLNSASPPATFLKYLLIRLKREQAVMFASESPGVILGTWPD